MNTFADADNDPANYIDPSGQASILTKIAIGAGAVGIAAGFTALALGAAPIAPVIGAVAVNADIVSLTAGAGEVFGSP